MMETDVSPLFCFAPQSHSKDGVKFMLESGARRATASGADGRFYVRPAALLIVLSAVCGNLSAQTTRDWRYWPFGASSPWNQPIGSGAQYAPVAGLSNLPITLNSTKWTTAIVIASTSSPAGRILYSPSYGPYTNIAFVSRGTLVCGNSSTVDNLLKSHATPNNVFAANFYSTTSTPNSSLWALPGGYYPASSNYTSTPLVPAGTCPSPDADGYLTVIQPDGFALDTINTVVTNDNSILTPMASYIDLRGDGTGVWDGRRASMLPSFAGLIRTGEIANGSIPHALAALMAPTMLAESAVWPAWAFDRNSRYSGNLPMGSLLAIPQSVNLNNLKLSPQGLVVAKAAQNYGIYIVDRGGSGFSLLAQLGDPEIPWGGPQVPYTYQDLAVIRNELQLVTNNTPTTPGGGGSPLAPPAPPFSSLIERPGRSNPLK
jgi:hypothetical protein